MRYIIYLLLLIKLSLYPSFAQEICNNAIDDDADGLIDLLDTASCLCQGFGSVHNTISFIVNPSFEQMSQCPNNYGQIDQALPWVMASSANQTSYLNTCGYMYNSVNQGGLIPFPDGDGIAAAFIQQGWTEYVATCLNQALTAGTHYTLKFNIATNPILVTSGPYVDLYNGGSITYGPISMSIFGTANCNQLPFNGYGCPGSNTWTLLGSVTYNPSNTWQIISIDFVPSSPINAIAIGAPCVVPTSYPTLSQNWCPVFYYDTFILNETDFFSMVHLTKIGTSCDTSITIAATTDTSGGSWQWYKNGIALIGETNNTLTISSSTYGTGLFTARYDNGSSCGTSNIDILLHELPDPEISSNINSGCVPLEVSFQDNLIFPTISCVWNFSDGSSIDQCGTVIHKFEQPGCYDISLRIITNDSCLVTKTFEDYICVTEAPVAAFEYSPESADIVTNELLFHNLSQHADNYTWNFGDGTESDLTNPAHTYESLNGSTYEVLLIAKNNDVCIDSSKAYVTIKDHLIYYIPNSFTPNGDNLNDEFQPVFSSGFIPDSYCLQIFDRWGNLVFKSIDSNKGWNGENSSIGLYTYKIDFISKGNGELQQLFGYISLLK